MCFTTLSHVGDRRRTSEVTSFVRFFRPHFARSARDLMKGFLVMFSRRARSVLALSTSAGLLAGAGLLTAAPAAAHASVQLYGGKATAGGYGALWMRIPHGCDGSPTKRIAITIPASFGSVKPQMIGGWQAKVVLRPDGSRRVVWNAVGKLLPDDQFADFGISVRWPTTPGSVALPTIQTCRKGKVAWIGDEVPTVVVDTASEGHGH